MKMELSREAVPSPSLPLGGPPAPWMQGSPLRTGTQARAVCLLEPGIAQLRTINTFHVASSGGSNILAHRLGGLLSKGHHAAPLSCPVDPMLLLIGKLRPGTDGDLPKVAWESGAESKPLKLSQARVPMDSRPHYSQKHGSGRGRQPACTGTFLSGRGMAPIAMSMGPP